MTKVKEMTSIYLWLIVVFILLSNYHQLTVPAVFDLHLDPLNQVAIFIYYEGTRLITILLVRKPLTSLLRPLPFPFKLPFPFSLHLPLPFCFFFLAE